MEISKRIYNKIKKPFLNFCIMNKISANQITVFNMLFVLIGICFLLSRGNYLLNWIALIMVIISSIIDYADGDLAKKTNTVSEAGEWIDSYSDIFLQNTVMGAIAIGNFKYSLPLFFIVLFFISNSALNLVSLQYNNRFGFSSYRGNEIFRKFMDKKSTLINRFFKGLIDPTYSKIALLCYSVRYWLILGILFNQMKIIFIIITLLTLFRMIIMYLIYTFYLLGNKKLWVLQALALLDEGKEIFYTLRSNDYGHGV